jgi:hypothetical protein
MIRIRIEKDKDKDKDKDRYKDKDKERLVGWLPLSPWAHCHAGPKTEP